MRPDPLGGRASLFFRSIAALLIIGQSSPAAADSDGGCMAEATRPDTNRLVRACRFGAGHARTVPVPRLGVTVAASSAYATTVVLRTVALGRHPTPAGVHPPLLHTSQPGAADQPGDTALGQRARVPHRRPGPGPRQRPGRLQPSPPHQGTHGRHGRIGPKRPEVPPRGHEQSLPGRHRPRRSQHESPPGSGDGYLHLEVAFIDHPLPVAVTGQHHAPQPFGDCQDESVTEGQGCVPVRVRWGRSWVVV